MKYPKPSIGDVVCVTHGGPRHPVGSDGKPDGRPVKFDDFVVTGAGRLYFYVHDVRVGDLKFCLNDWREHHREYMGSRRWAFPSIQEVMSHAEAARISSELRREFGSCIWNAHPTLSVEALREIIEIVEASK